MLNFCDFIKVNVFTTNHHLKRLYFFLVIAQSYTEYIYRERINIKKSDSLNFFYYRLTGFM